MSSVETPESAGRELPPVVVSCHGGTPAAQLAEDVASRLAERGGAELADAEAVVRGDYAGRTVAAVDGCSSACGARLLVARGVQPDVTLAVSELQAASAAPATAEGLDALAAGVAERIASGPSQPLRHVRPRRPQPQEGAAEGDGSRSHSVDDYLRAVDALTAPVADCGALATAVPTLAAYVSTVLGVTRVSAGAMLTRLEGTGLIERNAAKEVLLTPAGRIAADEAVRRLRLLECFVVDFLGYDAAACRAEARPLANSFDAEAIERIRLSLGEPVRCPHGWPIDPAEAREESRRLVALPALRQGDRAVVARLVEEDEALLRRLFAAGVAPGAEVEVVAAGSGRDGALAVRATGGPGGELLVLAEAEANGVIVAAPAPAGSPRP